ncbi:hypothetical protein BDZ85DRAFT_322167 [Elsinoe ampelina]|uniref:Rhodopsin domain-containing protein n=1 Tax=Elsinoe ampelina TaxID=302913 RepID=A0A6A6G227_9PEZI|nr:hypothetical protein BDZ85DRAFT_322167 [Elsinoe ampelina]
MATIPTEYSTGPDKHLYIEPVGVLRSQIDGVYALSIIFFILCWVTVSLRMWVRTTMLKGMGVDDWWLLITQVIFSIYAILLCIICNELLTHVNEYAAGEVPTSITIPNMVVAGYCLYATTTITFKISLGYFFLNIFSTERKWRVTIWLSMVLPGLLGVLNIAWTSTYRCQLTSVFFAGLPSCPSFKARTDWAVVAAMWAGVSAITDLIYGVLAFMAIKSLRMPWRTRITAALLCSLGCVGGVAAVIRLVFLIISVPNMSVLGEALQVSLWSVIEPGLAIIAAAIAALRPLWMKMKDPNWRPTHYSSNTRPNTRPNTRGGTNSNPAQRSHQIPMAISSHNKDDRILVQVELDQIHSERDRGDHSGKTSDNFNRDEIVDPRHLV